MKDVSEVARLFVSLVVYDTPLLTEEVCWNKINSEQCFRGRKVVSRVLYPSASPNLEGKIVVSFHYRSNASFLKRTTRVGPPLAPSGYAQIVTSRGQGHA